MSGVLGVLGGGGQGKCVAVTFSPATGQGPLNVHLSTSQTGGHIFYTKALDIITNPPAIIPTHTGDVATGTTVRIGTNSGNVGTTSQFCTLSALCYQSGYLDSDIVTREYGGNPP